MIHITYKTEQHDTKINSVEYCDECLDEDSCDSEKDTSCCESRNEKTFCVNEKSDYIYLLVCETDDGCCCMSGSTEQVMNVSTNFKQIINTLMKYTHKISRHISKDYDIRSYILVNDVRYTYAQTYTINRHQYVCEDANYIFVWLHNGNKNIPFPDETQEHFDNKLREYEAVCIKSKEYHKKIDDMCNKITTELSEQIQQEKQTKKDLLQKLNTICNLSEIKYKHIYDLDDALTVTQKILNDRIAEIRERKDLKTLKY